MREGLSLLRNEPMAPIRPDLATEVEFLALNVKAHVVLVARLLGVALLLVVPSTSVTAQQGSTPPDTARAGTLSGTVVSDAGDPLAGARVVLEEGELSTVSDEKGSFAFGRVPAGDVTITASLEGYLSQTLSVEVAPGRDSQQEILLPKEDQRRTIVTVGKLRADTERAQIKDRRFASNVVDNIGKQEMSAAGKSDVAEAVESLPGVSLVGAFAYVRGLGGRYSQVLYNRLRLPSPEPEKRVVALDQFPANLVESISVAKTYSPELPAEFAGGSVQIRSIDVPREGFLTFSFSGKFRDGTTFNNFETYRGGNADIVTFDDGARELPGAIPGTRVQVGANGLNSSTVQGLGRSFGNNWNNESRTAPPDHKLSVSAGDSFEVGEGILGVVAGVNWGNKYLQVSNETTQVVINAGSTDAPEARPRNTFSLDTSTFEAEVSALVNLTYELNPAQRVGIRNFVTRSSTDRVRLQEGFDQQLGDDLRVIQLRWVEKALYNSQLFGEHLLAGDIFATWHAAVSYTERDEPDRRQVQYEFDNGEFTFRNISESGSRDFLYQDELLQDYALNLAIPFSPFGVADSDSDPDRLDPEQKIQFGASVVQTERDFDARRFRFVPQGAEVDEFGNPLDYVGPPEEIFAPAQINPDGLELREFTRAEDSYDGTQDIYAGYVSTAFRVTEWLRIQGGVRYEDSNQQVDTIGVGGPVTSTVDEQDWVPSLNVTFALPADMQVRLAGSRTVSRPEFRELSPFQFRDQAGGFAARGNPDLDRALITSYDLRWEWFPSPGDLFSISGFYKDFEDPIEKVIIPTASDPITSWENADAAEVMGVEVELRKNLGFLSRVAELDLFEQLTFRANFAYIDSEVESSQNPLFVQTNDSRPLEGQPEYTLNLGLFYDSRDLGLACSVTMNTFGETIVGVGTQGVDDEVSVPRFALDINLSKDIGRGTLSVSVENILDDDFKTEQDGFDTRKFKTGIAFGIGYSLTF